MSCLQRLRQIATKLRSIRILEFETYSVKHIDLDANCVRDFVGHDFLAWDFVVHYWLENLSDVVLPFTISENSLVKALHKFAQTFIFKEKSVLPCLICIQLPRDIHLIFFLRKTLISCIMLWRAYTEENLYTYQLTIAFKHSNFLCANRL